MNKKPRQEIDAAFFFEKLNKFLKNRQDSSKTAFLFDKPESEMYNVMKILFYYGTVHHHANKILGNVKYGGLIQKWLITQIPTFW